MYQFNLEPLLNHRRYQEEVLQKELADLKTDLEIKAVSDYFMVSPLEQTRDNALQGYLLIVRTPNPSSQDAEGQLQQQSATPSAAVEPSSDAEAGQEDK